MQKAMVEQQRFRAPVPGQGMTADLKSRPWLNPPKINTVEDAMEFYFERIIQEESSTKLLGLMKTGLPISVIAESMTTGGVMEGVHSVDVAFLLNPILMEFMKGMAEIGNVKYTLDSELPKNKKPNKAAIASVLEKLDESKEEIKEVAETVQENKGLMSRKKEETK